MSNIEWTDKTWNPVRGCSRVSAGCTNCYAERQAIRHAGPGGAYEGLVRTVNGHPTWTGKITLVPEKLTEPMRWRKPCRVFVNSMGDLFHDHVPDEFIDQVFAVMALAPQHTFQILTKRPDRMQEYFAPYETEIAMRWGAAAGTLLDGEWIWNEGKRFRERIEAFISAAHGFYSDDETLLENDDALPMPLPNVSLGVSVEDQATANERIPLLLQTPAAVRFVSYEPALGPVNFGEYIGSECPHDDSYMEPDTGATICLRCDEMELLDWLIVGGESGPGARACNVEWIRSAVQQCREAGTRCFVKQLGARPYRSCGCEVRERQGGTSRCADCFDGTQPIHIRGRKGGDMDEWPEDLRVREFPA